MMFLPNVLLFFGQGIFAILVAVRLLGWLVGWLVGWLIDWLVGWQVTQLVVWLADCLLRIHISVGEIHIFHQFCPCLYGFTSFYQHCFMVNRQLPDGKINILHCEIHIKSQHFFTVNSSQTLRFHGDVKSSSQSLCEKTTFLLVKLPFSHAFPEFFPLEEELGRIEVSVELPPLCSALFREKHRAWRGGGTPMAGWLIRESPSKMDN